LALWKRSKTSRTCPGVLGFEAVVFVGFDFLPDLLVGFTGVDLALDLTLDLAFADFFGGNRT